MSLSRSRSHEEHSMKGNQIGQQWSEKHHYFIEHHIIILKLDLIQFTFKLFFNIV